MELKEKGAAADVGSFQQLQVTMTWTTATDFDLSAVYETRDGEHGLVYFGDLGELDVFPYIQLSGDSGVGDSGGDNREALRIARLDGLKAIWLMCWDYNQVQAGAPARFEDSDITLSLMDDTGAAHSVSLEAGTEGNVAVIATIHAVDGGARLVNTSRGGTLHGLTDLNQLLDLVEG